MKKKIVGAIAVGAAGLGLIVLGTGTASADPTCLVDTVHAVVGDPQAVLVAVVSDPAGALGADLTCVHEVLTP